MCTFATWGGASDKMNCVTYSSSGRGDEANTPGGTYWLVGRERGWAGSEAEAVASEMRNGRLARTAAPLNATHLTTLPLVLN